MTTIAINTLGGQRGDLTRRNYSRSNVGGFDRVIRVALGALLLADGLHGTGPLGMDGVLMLVSIPLIISAIIAWDPLYALFQVRTATLPAHQIPQWKLSTLNANGGINVGTADRLLRIVLASGLLATPFLWTGSIGIMAVATTGAGIIVMMTAVMGWDPFYQSAGVRTVTLPIESVPEHGKDDDINHLDLFDKVKGSDDDIYQIAA